DHYDTVQINVVAVLQVVGERGVAERPVAFADQKFRRVPTVVARNVNLDELCERLYVGVDAPEIFVLRFADRGAEARTDGVDKDESGRRGEVLRFFWELVGGGRGDACFCGSDAARTKRANMKPYRRRARTAVIKEGNRSRAQVLHIAARVSCGINQRDR